MPIIISGVKYYTSLLSSSPSPYSQALPFDRSTPYIPKDLPLSLLQLHSLIIKPTIQSSSVDIDQPYHNVHTQVTGSG